VRAGSPARTGLSAAALAARLTLLAVALVTARGSWSAPAVSDLPVDAAIGLVYPVTGALVRRGNRALGAVFLVAGLAGALVAVTTAVAATADSATWWAGAAAWLQSWLWVPAFAPLLTLLPLLYPDGRLPWRWTGPAAVGGIALLSLAVALHDEPFQGQVLIDKPLTHPGLAVPAAVAGAALVVPAALAGLAALAVRVHRATGLARRQLVVFLAAAALVLLEVLLHGSLPAAVGAVTQPVAVVLLPLAVGVAVTRHRLYDLDLALLRLLVGVSLVACLAGAYLILFGVLRAVVPALATPLAAGLTGLVVQPLGVRLARAGDRMYYGDRADPYAVLAGLSSRLSDGSVADVPREVCDAVVRSLKLRGAQLVVAGRTVAASGEQDGPTEDFALRHRGRDVGRFLVTARAGEDALDVRDRELLQALADAAAPALSAVKLYEDLQASREALVSGREEERRRLRRDLHDGVGAALAGARLQLESARELVHDPLAARLLDAAGGAVAEAVADVRRVTEDLRPPALDEIGLAACVRELAARVRTPALAVEADVDDLPPLPAAVEVACYRIAGEALTNGARHAGATSVRLSLALDAGQLVLEVVDDGRGLPASPKEGVGMTSMRQRAEELGGRLTVSSRGGTTVRAVLPA
jgi:signal transduction histidine kinase